MSTSSDAAGPPAPPSNSSPPALNCLIFGRSRLILTAFSVTNILLILPPTFLVLHLGCRRWRRRRRVSSAPSDVFAYHVAAMETVTVSGCVLYCVGVGVDVPAVFMCGFYMFFSTWCVKIHFHTLTCVERYLAVVHPVAYLGLKNAGGVRLRNASVACVWLLCVVWAVLVSQTQYTVRIIAFFSLAAPAFAVVCFCCVSVLRALRRPGPGGAAGRRRQQVKLTAFNTLATITAVLWLCSGGMLVCNVLVETGALSNGDGCVVRASAIWFSLPSSLVLPLLYLHRAGTLPGCRA